MFIAGLFKEIIKETRNQFSDFQKDCCKKHTSAKLEWNSIKNRRVTAVSIKVISLFFWHPSLVDWDETQVMIRHQYVILLGSVPAFCHLACFPTKWSHQIKDKAKSHVFCSPDFSAEQLEEANFAIKVRNFWTQYLRGFSSYYFKTWQKYVFHNVFLENKKN